MRTSDPTATLGDMRDHTSRCCERIHPTGELAGSWVRDHVCRLPWGHAPDIPHECTCGWAWSVSVEAERIDA